MRSSSMHYCSRGWMFCLITFLDQAAENNGSLSFIFIIVTSGGMVIFRRHSAI